MTEEEKIKDAKQTRRTLILVCIGFTVFVAYLINRNNSVDTSTYKPYVNTNTEYGSGSSVEKPNIVSCPKCGKSYNKNTWGEMCNTCWSEGRGLKSKGEYIVK